MANIAHDGNGSRPRIFVTGLGLLCPLGADVQTFWANLVAGRCGLSEIDKIDTSGLRNPRGGQVHDFELQFDGECDEASEFALFAAEQAAAHAHLGEEEKQRAGLVFSTNFGGAASWETACELAREGAPDAETFALFEPSHAADFLAARWNNAGPRATLSNACSGGAHAIGLAAQWLRSGRCEVAVAGGFDGLGISTLAGLSILRTISPDEIRPFDARRNGTIFGEGAAFCVLETEDSLHRRGALPLAEILGWSVNNNAHHLTAPDKGGAGLAGAMHAALRDAQTAPETVGYINAHGTGTAYNDVAETEAIKAVFGSHARDVPISSIKAATGHLMGAAGALEAIACVLALQSGTLPPTLNLEEADPSCDLDYVPLQARTQTVEIALTNSSGIGGNNACLVLKRTENVRKITDESENRD